MVCAASHDSIALFFRFPLKVKMFGSSASKGIDRSFGIIVAPHHFRSPDTTTIGVGIEFPPRKEASPSNGIKVSADESLVVYKFRPLADLEAVMCVPEKNSANEELKGPIFETTDKKSWPQLQSLLSARSITVECVETPDMGDLQVAMRLRRAGEGSLSPAYFFKANRKLTNTITAAVRPKGGAYRPTRISMFDSIGLGNDRHNANDYVSIYPKPRTRWTCETTADRGWMGCRSKIRLRPPQIPKLPSC